MGIIRRPLQAALMPAILVVRFVGLTARHAWQLELSRVAQGRRGLLRISRRVSRGAGVAAPVVVEGDAETGLSTPWRPGEVAIVKTGGSPVPDTDETLASEKMASLGASDKVAASSSPVSAASAAHTGHTFDRELAAGMPPTPLAVISSVSVLAPPTPAPIAAAAAAAAPAAYTCNPALEDGRGGGGDGDGDDDPALPASRLHTWAAEADVSPTSSRAPAPWLDALLIRFRLYTWRGQLWLLSVWLSPWLLYYVIQLFLVEPLRNPNAYGCRFQLYDNIFFVVASFSYVGLLPPLLWRIRNSPDSLGLRAELLLQLLFWPPHLLLLLYGVWRGRGAAGVHSVMLTSCSFAPHIHAQENSRQRLK